MSTDRRCTDMHNETQRQLHTHAESKGFSEFVYIACHLRGVPFERVQLLIFVCASLYTVVSV